VKPLSSLSLLAVVGIPKPLPSIYKPLFDNPSSLPNILSAAPSTKPILELQSLEPYTCSTSLLRTPTKLTASASLSNILEDNIYYTLSNSLQDTVSFILSPNTLILDEYRHLILPNPNCRNKLHTSQY
jgi:hypothetical protein